MHVLDYFTFELIHMNGRMYDFNTGRFLSVDPFIQGVDSQSINPYSYIQNNPLAGTDPTGYRGFIYLAHLIKEVERAFKSLNRKVRRNNEPREKTIRLPDGWNPEIPYIPPSPPKPVTGFRPSGSIDTSTELTPATQRDSSTKTETDSGYNPSPVMNSEEGDISGTEGEVSKGKKPSKTFEDLVGEAEPGPKTKGKSQNHDQIGGFEDANDDFDSLSPIDVEDISGGRIGTLEDGTKVIVRDNDTDPKSNGTLQNNRGNKKIKIRYKDKELD